MKALNISKSFVMQGSNPYKNIEIQWLHVFICTDSHAIHVDRRWNLEGANQLPGTNSAGSILFRTTHTLAIFWGQVPRIRTINVKSAFGETFPFSDFRVPWLTHMKV